MSFGIYIVGFAVLTCGLIYAATLLHVHTQWIVVGAVIMMGAGLMAAVKATKQRDSPDK